MENLNTLITLKNRPQNMIDLSRRREEDEQVFYKYLKGGIDEEIFKNPSFFRQNQIEYFLNSEQFIQNLKEILNETNTLNNFIKNFDNQFIRDVFVKFLDVSKNDVIHIIKTPKLLSIPKYKIIFWKLLFTYENKENFEVEFIKLIKKISENHPKKNVLEVLNFGIALIRIKAS